MTIDPQVFRETMAHWASGVTVVTTLVDGEPTGITASSFASLSLHPPQILVCINKKLHTHQAIETSGTFAVNILGIEHQAWGMRFAGMFPEIVDRFQGIAWETAVTGSPLLPGVLGWLDCEVRAAYMAGDHTIFVGEVMATSARKEGAPILYYNRKWRELAEQPLELK
ncbi:MAG: flavin reductase family protein [Chloroflexi bacterium]|nr:flavin reductase family protein [Chloroflexota bacterium]